MAALTLPQSLTLTKTRCVDSWFVRRFKGHRVVHFLYEQDELQDHEVPGQERSGRLCLA